VQIFLSLISDQDQLARIIAPRRLDKKTDVIGRFGKALQELPFGQRLISTPFSRNILFLLRIHENLFLNEKNMVSFKSLKLIKY
jgi:hypothetical protein